MTGVVTSWGCAGELAGATFFGVPNPAKALDIKLAALGLGWTGCVEAEEATMEWSCWLEPARESRGVLSANIVALHGCWVKVVSC